MVLHGADSLTLPGSTGLLDANHIESSGELLHIFLELQHAAGGVVVHRPLEVNQLLAL